MSYKLVKPNGTLNKMAIVNTDTSSRIELGRVTNAITLILDEHSVEHPAYANTWDIEISPEVANKLAGLVTITGKPPKRTKKSTEEAKETKVETKEETTKDNHSFADMSLLFDTL